MTTNASISIPFAIGETVWLARIIREEVRQTCPECFGSKALTMVKGNGEQVSIACATCTVSYEPPSGLVTNSFWSASPEKFTCGRVDIYGDSISYSESGPDATCYGSVDAKHLFRDYEECVAKCRQLRDEQHKTEEETRVRNISSKRRDMAWSVHYWGRKVKDLERELDSAKARLSICKTLNNKDKITNEPI